eukprot:COSAG02_NODE_1789_length_10924_cov_4.791224_1_plen_464_part_10
MRTAVGNFRIDRPLARWIASLLQREPRTWSAAQPWRWRAVEMPSGKGRKAAAVAALAGWGEGEEEEEGWCGEDELALEVQRAEARRTKRLQQAMSPAPALAKSAGTGKASPARCAAPPQTPMSPMSPQKAQTKRSEEEILEWVAKAECWHKGLHSRRDQQWKKQQQQEMQELEEQLEAARVSKGKKLSKQDVDTMLERLQQQQQRPAAPPAEAKDEVRQRPSKKLSKTDLDKSVSRLYSPPASARAGRWTEHTAPLHAFASPYGDPTDQATTVSNRGSAWELATPRGLEAPASQRRRRSSIAVTEWTLGALSPTKRSPTKSPKPKRTVAVAVSSPHSKHPRIVIKRLQMEPQPKVKPQSEPEPEPELELEPEPERARKDRVPLGNASRIERPIQGGSPRSDDSQMVVLDVSEATEPKHERSDSNAGQMFDRILAHAEEKRANVLHMFYQIDTGNSGGLKRKEFG